MKLSLLLVALISLVSFAYAWTKEDHEIFDLVSAIEAAEGKGTTFYSWLEVSPKATSPEIGKAYRKKSMVMHPDKNPGVKGIEERFARLGVVAAILRDEEGRKRYDFFFKNGVPRWRGTGYYYSRYRPGLGSVLVFLTLLSSVLQLVIQKYNHKQDLARIDRFVAKARLAAWGPKLIPQPGSKKVRVSLETSGPEQDGRSVEMLVDEQHVYLVGDEGHVPLDENMAPKPTITNTWAINLVKALFQKVFSKGQPATEETSDQPGQGAELSGSGEEDTDAAEGTDGGASTPSGLKGGVAAAMKAGGRRRKTFPKKR